MGCAATPGGLPAAVQRQRAGRQVDTYQVLSPGLGAAGDGYTFRNSRFRFEFSKEFDNIEGYNTPEARFERGKAASEILNGGYEFVHGIFGIASKRVIRVRIVPAIDGDPHDANAQVQWQTSMGRMVEDSQEVTMTFGAGAFQSRSSLAHELSHALLSPYLLPAWLDEGIATLVQYDYALGRPLTEDGTLLTPLGLDKDGYNTLERWRGDASALPFRSPETYAHAYAIVKEIQRRYGNDIFIRLFQDFAKTKPHLQGKQLDTSDILAGLNRVTGQDVRPFFDEIRFRTGRSS
jgi:hypothetical protein